MVAERRPIAMAGLRAPGMTAASAGPCRADHRRPIARGWQSSNSSCHFVAGPRDTGREPGPAVAGGLAPIDEGARLHAARSRRGAHLGAVAGALARAAGERPRGSTAGAPRRRSGLGMFGGDQASEALERVLLEERAPTVRRMTAYALSRMDDEPASSALETARSDRDRVRAIVQVRRSRAGLMAMVLSSSAGGSRGRRGSRG
jgi:hypothetical protein